MAQLVNVQELFNKSSSQSGSGSSGKGATFASFAEEQHRLLKCQITLEEKLPGKGFIGLTLHSTLSDLVRDNEMKLADKVSNSAILIMSHISLYGERVMLAFQVILMYHNSGPVYVFI